MEGWTEVRVCWDEYPTLLALVRRGLRDGCEYFMRLCPPSFPRFDVNGELASGPDLFLMARPEDRPEEGRIYRTGSTIEVRAENRLPPHNPKAEINNIVEGILCGRILSTSYLLTEIEKLLRKMGIATGAHFVSKNYMLYNACGDGNTKTKMLLDALHEELLIPTETSLHPAINSPEKLVAYNMLMDLRSRVSGFYPPLMGILNYPRSRWAEDREGVIAYQGEDAENQMPGDIWQSRFLFLLGKIACAPSDVALLKDKYWVGLNECCQKFRVKIHRSYETCRYAVLGDGTNPLAERLPNLNEGAPVYASRHLFSPSVWLSWAYSVLNNEFFMSEVLFFDAAGPDAPLMLNGDRWHPSPLAGHTTMEQDVINYFLCAGMERHPGGVLPIYAAVRFNG